MFDMADTDALIDSSTGAPVAATNIAPSTVMSRNVVKKPITRWTMSLGTLCSPSLIGSTPRG